VNLDNLLSGPGELDEAGRPYTPTSSGRMLVADLDVQAGVARASPPSQLHEITDGSGSALSDLFRLFNT
jgi:hypothetical protein